MMQQLIEDICNSLKQGQDLVMATILSKQGSAPRSAGTRMLVHPDGRISGTIGGGWVEAQIQQRAKALFEQTRSGAMDTVQDSATIRRFILDSKIYAEMDMVCGGNVSILTEYVAADQENIALFSRFLDHLKGQTTCFLVNRLDKGVDNDSEAGFRLQRCVVSGLEKDGIVSQHGTLSLGDRALAELITESRKMRSPGVIEVDKETYFLEPAQFNGTLYIFGAGHLGVETARLAHKVGFRTMVLDDRSEFANQERFPHAEVHVVENLARCFDSLDIGPDSFITVMTRGHLFDRQILEQALKTDAQYIGMIGSRSKREAIYAYLLEEGVSQARLDEIYSPIGLSIGAQTPEEIAVSIVAELIQARFKGKSSPEKSGTK